MTVTFTWQDPPKRWAIEWWLPLPGGHGAQRHARKIDSQAPIDAVTAAQLVNALENVLRQEALW